MEHTLSKCYRCFGIIASYPYQIRLIPGTVDYNISVGRKFQFILYVISQLCVTAHLIKLTSHLVHFFDTYVENKEYIRLVFPSIWIVSFIIVLAQQLPCFINTREVMQLGNGTVVCMRKLERGKKSNNL